MVGAAQRKPTGVLVVAAWRQGAPSRVAARITYTVDVTRSARVTVTAAGVEAIATAIREWLDEIGAA